MRFCRFLGFFESIFASNIGGNINYRHDPQHLSREIGQNHGEARPALILNLHPRKKD